MVSGLPSGRGLDCARPFAPLRVPLAVDFRLLGALPFGLFGVDSLFMLNAFVVEILLPAITEVLGVDMGQNEYTSTGTDRKSHRTRKEARP